MSDSLNIDKILLLQLKQLGELEVLLNDEQQILQHHNPEKLVAVNHAKTELLGKIESTDQLLATSPKFLESKNNGQYDDELQSIKSRLKICKDINQINGDIIGKSQLSIERMRASLLENHTKSTMTYDKKGKKSGGLSSMDLKA